MSEMRAVVYCHFSLPQSSSASRHQSEELELLARTVGPIHPNDGGRTHRRLARNMHPRAKGRPRHARTHPWAKAIARRDRSAVLQRPFSNRWRFLTKTKKHRGSHCLSVTTLQRQFCPNLRWCEACGSQTLPYDGQGPPFAHRKIPQTWTIVLAARRDASGIAALSLRNRGR